MNSAIKRKWVEALVSEKYQQARNHMHLTDGYCCLGVLREVMGTNGTSNYVLTDSERRQAGLKEKEVGALVELNDHFLEGKPCSVPFPLIAGFVNENL